VNLLAARVTPPDTIQAGAAAPGVGVQVSGYGRLADDHVYLQAGLTVAPLARQGITATAVFGGEMGRTFYLEPSPALGPSALWRTVAGPLTGTNRLQTLTDPAATGTRSFFRLRAM